MEISFNFRLGNLWLCSHFPLALYELVPPSQALTISKAAIADVHRPAWNRVNSWLVATCWPTLWILMVRIHNNHSMVVNVFACDHKYQVPPIYQWLHSTYFMIPKPVTFAGHLNPPVNLASQMLASKDGEKLHCNWTTNKTLTLTFQLYWFGVPVVWGFASYPGFWFDSRSCVAGNLPPVVHGGQCYHPPHPSWLTDRLMQPGCSQALCSAFYTLHVAVFCKCKALDS